MISGKNIHKRYGKVEVLKGVDVEINKGEVVSIVGPSGSGKSTLLHILGTLDKADQGTVMMNQSNLTALTGKFGSCFLRVKRSSCAAAIISPSSIIAAAES